MDMIYPGGYMKLDSNYPPCQPPAELSERQ